MNKMMPEDHMPQTTAVTGNRLFPVFIKLENLRLLLVGGGFVAQEKLNAILANAPETQITIVAPVIREEIKTIQQQQGHIKIIQRAFEAIDLQDKDLVIIAVEGTAVSAEIRQQAKAKGLLVNVADQPDLCDFYLGSIVKKGDLKIAISTNGKSPTVAKRLKEVLQESIPDEIDDVLQQVHRLRQQMKGDFSDKVKQLNALTIGLIEGKGKESSNGEKKWRKVASWCAFAFIFLFIGNIISAYITVQDIGEGFLYVNAQVDKQFYWMLLAGFLAQMVDGALGMGYGVTCTSVLLYIGVPLPAISSSIHTAEMFSSGASGFSHYRFGNVNKKLFKLIIIPGVLGAIGGAWLLSTFGEQYAQYFRPILAAYTLLLGTKILLNAFKKKRKREKLKRVGWLAGAGGFLDSFGGGGWGPLVTSTLISKGKSPKYVIGTVSLTEFFVTLASAVTFFSVIGISHWQVIAGLVIGGMVAAPFAARLAGKLPLKTMFIAVGSLIIIWSLNILIKTIG